MYIYIYVCVCMCVCLSLCACLSYPLVHTHTNLLLTHLLTTPCHFHFHYHYHYHCHRYKMRSYTMKQRGSGLKSTSIKTFLILHARTTMARTVVVAPTAQRPQLQVGMEVRGPVAYVPVLLSLSHTHTRAGTLTLTPCFLTHYYLYRSEYKRAIQCLEQ